MQQMKAKIKNFIADKLNDDILFIGDVHEDGDKINFNARIKYPERKVDIPKSCRVLNIDAAFGLGVYIKIEINKNKLLHY